MAFASGFSAAEGLPPSPPRPARRTLPLCLLPVVLHTPEALWGWRLSSPRAWLATVKVPKGVF